MIKRTYKQKAGIAAVAVAIAMPAEGLRQWWYYCPAGIVSICYGSTGNVDKGRKYSMDECKALLDAEMLHYVELVDRCQPGLPEPVLAAFADAAYNIGPKVACGPGSTAARLLKSRDYEAACNQLPRWNKSTVAGKSIELAGLTKRRAQEQALCLTGA